MMLYELQVAALLSDKFVVREEAKREAVALLAESASEAWRSPASRSKHMKPTCCRSDEQSDAATMVFERRRMYYWMW